MNLIQVPPINDPQTSRPVWSVMIPTYNCSAYLKETIQSVLIQDRGVGKMEIWVVDDCSSDMPRQIVNDFGNGRINFYRQKQNVGQTNNFSTCLNMAKGKIVHLLHGDDFVHPGFYQSLELPLLADDGIGAAFTGNNIIDETGNIIFVSNAVADRPGIIDDFISIIASRQVIQTPSIVVKREVYEKIGAFNKELSWVEDWEMWIRIACNFKFYYTPQNLASYRIHKNSNTTNSLKTGRFVEDIIRCINIYSGYLKLPANQKKILTGSAKKHFLNYAITQSRLSTSALILLRSLPLVNNFSSFIQWIKNLITISIKTTLYFKSNTKKLYNDQ